MSINLAAQPLKSRMSLGQRRSPGIANARLTRGPGKSQFRTGRHSISLPLPPRPLSPNDRQYLRALREAEMALWLGIQTTAEVFEEPAPRPSVGKLFSELSTGHQKREFALLMILAAAALIAISSAFLQSGSFLQRWAEFVQNVRGF